MTTTNHKELLKKVRRIEIQTRHAVHDVFAGQYHSVFKGRGMEFDRVREYVPGDDIRAIDWNVTARTGVPHIKKFVEERERTVMLLVDISASHAFGSTPQLKRDLAAEIAAVLAFSAMQTGDRVGLILFSDRVEKTIAPRKGTPHILRLIREILHFEPESRATDPVPSLDWLNHTLTRKAITFLISDLRFPENCERILKITARHHDLIAVRIGDKLEQAWPKVGVIHWRDAETGESVLVDTSNAATRQALLTAELNRLDQQQMLLRRAGIDLIELCAGEPYEKALIQFFRTRSRRR